VFAVRFSRFRSPPCSAIFMSARRSHGAAPAFERQRRALPAAVTICSAGTRRRNPVVDRFAHRRAHRRSPQAQARRGPSSGSVASSCAPTSGSGRRGRAFDRADASRRRTNLAFVEVDRRQTGGHGLSRRRPRQPGHGESDWSTDADYGIQTMATDVLNALSALGRPAVLVGASMGGLTSLLVAQQAGASRVVALILVDVVPRYEKAGSKRVRDFMLGGLSGFATLDEAADAVSAYLPHRPRPRSSAGLRRNLRQQPEGRWYWNWDPTFMQHPDDDPDGRLKQFEDATHAITVPMRLLHGGKFDVVGPEGVTRLLELAPHAQVMDLPTAAHRGG